MPNEPQLIPGQLKNPYYIASPAYTRTSAGIRVLHLLARALRLRGYPAYISGPSTNPIFETELLTEGLVQAHFDHGLTPIMVYPEVFWGNPHEAPVVVRFLLNFPGALGGPKEFPDNEMLISYGIGMKAAAGQTVDNLYIPVCDTSLYYPPPPGAKRSGSCFYAGKFKEVYQQETFAITDGMVEITRSGPNVMSPVEIAELFRTSEFFYCYENSSLCLEARLCGCPVILLPNPFFTELIASDEVGREGLAWGATPEQIAYAQETVGQVVEKYRAGEHQFWRNLDTFIEKTQSAARKNLYKKRIRFKAHQVGMGELEIYRARTSYVTRLTLSIVHLLKANGPAKILGDLLRSGGSPKRIKALLRHGECLYIAQSHHPIDG